MSRRHSILLTAIVAIGLPACDLLSGPESISVLVRTDTTEYDAVRIGPIDGHHHYRVHVVARIENTSRSARFLNLCGTTPFFSVVSGATTGDGLSGYNPAWSCAPTQVRLEPGEMRADSLVLLSQACIGMASRCHDEPLEGPMRLRFFPACARSSDCDAGFAASNVFTVKLPQL